ncbi:histidine phosphotransferase family protein [Ruixingdingia sedimenti]|uniref:Histidine phosphotransferase family protein n=1 Tax=Ruixingdingia sedimenti TaxID=3073604 RepID=A0ABU1F7R5_9RHOB|nr:histidine phosphotransferase family protein [Xinfangfangia sp. LG-4]MDR5652487.1 histidine phosphotransferase family protein [Xinfangfangia sp. LG-4]
MDKTELAALLGSRICHDLISPLGAIGNGVELLAMAGQGTGPEVALISESVANANARIRFFRVAYGMAGADQRMGRPEILSILGESTRGGRTVIDWRVAGDLPRREVRLAFLALQCLETAMPYGGQVAVDREGARWTLAGTARKLRHDAALWDALCDPLMALSLTPAQVHFGLLREDLTAQNRHAALRIADQVIELSF